MNKEITVFYKKSHNSSRKAIRFFEDNGIQIKKVNIQKESISPSLLFTLLKHTKNGVTDILSKSVKEEQLEKFENMSLMELLNFITLHPENQQVLTVPFIIEGDGDIKVCIGFNESEITTFLPTDKKEQLLNELYSKEMSDMEKKELEVFFSNEKAV